MIPSRLFKCHFEKDFYIGNLNRNGYRVRNGSSSFVIMQGKQWHCKNVNEENLKNDGKMIQRL